MRVLFCLLLLLRPIQAEQCLVLGDSLTKEYEAEFPGLYPQNPAAWQARNWIEILHQHRTDWFDTGTWDVYADARATGHAHNWALPGATTGEIKSILTNFFNQWWVNSLKNHIRYDVERVVIFAGGNDADSYYANLYNGLVGPEVTNPTLSNLQWLVGWVRDLNATVPIMLVSIPHVGCTPKIQQGYPTDVVKTARVSTAMDALNASLASYAQSQGIGFAPGVYEFTKALITQPFRIKGIEFYRVADADAGTRYAFSGDGFHPNTCAHTKIAQLIVEAFNSKYPSTPISPLDDDYIITNVLGLDPNIPFNEWMISQGSTGAFHDDSDGDGVPNLLEFALEGFAADHADTANLPQPVMQSGALTLTYRPRVVFTEWGSLKAQSSPDLATWTDVPAAQTMTNPDGTITVNAAFINRGFVRLKAVK
ncbi:GDSL-type esterase/lipase family protein [Prosthecobacter sp.]|uniref:SGNH/GDSL hydrolase family protein n=1 Tax=Prosthecobacter sp. TaxID=1965333 RepID=UPI002ABBBDB3|nr:GDSL-type esterase/lipase family protein [Prosthecobacter sp.]MDZ4401569.1 GDSL-type esterase/lipase family protein [Prosthecobacter sp.]